MSKMAETQGVSRANIYLIPPEQITVDELQNGRRFKRPVEELARSIALIGQIEPVVCRHNEQKQWQIVAGYRRLAAIKMVNEEKLTAEPLRVKVVLRECDDIEALELNATENAQRDDLSPIDYAYIIQRLLNFGRTQSEVAKLFHKSDGWVSMTLDLLEHEKPVQAKIHQGIIPATLAYEALKIEEPEARAELLAKAESQPVEARREIEQRKETRTRLRAEARGEAKPKTPRETRAFFESVHEELKESRNGDEEPGALESLCSEMVDWLDGKLSDRQMRNRLEKIA